MAKDNGLGILLIAGVVGYWLYGRKKEFDPADIQYGAGTGVGGEDIGSNGDPSKGRPRDFDTKPNR